MDAVWVASKTRRPGQRSAKTPPKREKSNTGKACSAPTRPSCHALWVSSSTSHACPMICIHVPITEIIWPDQYRRKLRCRNEVNARNRPLLLFYLSSSEKARIQQARAENIVRKNVVERLTEMI